MLNSPVQGWLRYGRAKQLVKGGRKVDYDVCACAFASAAAPTTGPVLDPDEPESVQKIRQRIHDVRVSLIRAAQRLGYDADNAIVRQVLYRYASRARAHTHTQPSCTA